MTGNDPHTEVMHLAIGHVIARAIHVVAELRIADLLGEACHTAPELAELTGTHAPSLQRLLRSLAGFGVFVQDERQRFSLGPLGMALRSGPPYAATAARTFGAAGMWNAFGDLLEAVRTGKPTLPEARRGELYRAEGGPELVAKLSETMIAFHGKDLDAVTSAYDFSAVRMVVDVGGSTGNLLCAILLANPHLKGVLYDRPAYVAEAHQQIKLKGLAARCEIAGGDFFTAVPAGGDAYLLSHVIHDWPEEAALSILRNCRRAMRQEARLLIIEDVIAPGHDLHFGKIADLILLACTGGQERSAEEHAALLSKAKFGLRRIIPTRTNVSIIEAAPV